jgi:hypothetical protein
MILSILAVVFCVVFTLPVWWEYKSEAVIYRSGIEGYFYNVTELVLNENYQYYYVKWGTFLVFRLFPFIALLIFNLFIFRAVSKNINKFKT